MGSQHNAVNWKNEKRNDSTKFSQGKTDLIENGFRGNFHFQYIGNRWKRKNPKLPL
jgi:hypothetical protein